MAQTLKRMAASTVLTASLGLGVLPSVSAANASELAGSEVVSASSPSSSEPRIMVINMENESMSDIIGNSSAPYQNQLASQFLELTRSYGVGHASLDNYLAQISGNFYAASVHDCQPGTPGTDGNPCTYTNPTLAQQMDSAGIPWMAFMESMNGYAQRASDGLYDTNHNPFVYFPAVVSADRSKIVPAGDDDSTMLATLNSSSAPDFVYFTPNVNDDGHDTGVAGGDSYLSQIIPEIQATIWYKGGGIIVLTYDEGDHSGGQTLGENLSGQGNHILTIVISAATAGKGQNGSYVNQFGLLRGLETAYGLSYLGQAANASNGQLPLGGAPRRAHRHRGVRHGRDS